MITQMLSKLFPVRLPSLNPISDLKEVMEYNGRMNRRGVENNPAMYGGVTIEAVREKFVPNRKFRVA